MRSAPLTVAAVLFAGAAIACDAVQEQATASFRPPVLHRAGGAPSAALAQGPAHPHDAASGAPAHEQPFLAENDAAMVKMMADMTITASGDIDRDFVEMMIPHHQGAIDMARAYLRYGDDPQLTRLAQEIIVEQVGEIAAMRSALGEPLPASAPLPTQPGAAATAAGATPHAGH